MNRAHKKAREKYKGPKETPCPELGCTDGIVRWVGLDDVFRQELCRTCGGSGYLSDAAGRLRV